MSFASIDFVFFFLIVIIGTTVIQSFFSEKIKQCFLLAASYFFYGWWDWRFCFLLFFVTVVSWVTAKKSNNKIIYAIGIVIPLIVLFYFKYFDFFLSSAMTVIGYNSEVLKIILPVGISFYTFQALSYVVDVHRGKLDVENDFIKLALYLSFFPQLVAGPIVRASDFLPQLREERRITIERLKYGIQLIAFGLFKKIVLADHISIFVDDVYRAPSAFHWTTLVWACISYSIQIYMDFSGYSDIAIGCAHCMGYDFKRNFNMPYLSKNMTEFWHRWHISLSTWLKEYLYIPLGGSRKGEVRRYLNLFLTMLLGGLWHGADWTFVVWGGVNGIALCIDKILPRSDNQSMKHQIVSSIMTFGFITFSWIFFRANTFSIAWAVIRGIFTFQKGIIQPFTWSIFGTIILLVCTLIVIARAGEKDISDINGYYPIVNLNSMRGQILFFVFLGMIFGLAYTGEQPFVYFQF